MSSGKQEASDVPSAAQIEGRYANGFQVGHNAFEFVIDFMQQYGDGDPRDAHTHTRVVTSPAYIKVFLEILATSIEHYESEFGAIAALPADSADHDAAQDSPPQR